MALPVLQKKVGETTFTRVVTSKEELDAYKAKGYKQVTAKAAAEVTEPEPPTK